MSSEDGVRTIEGDALRLGSGLYIDVENLHPDGQTVIEALLDGWPGEWPAPSCLTLYTRADQTELWRLWAQHRFGNLQVTAHGTQHFSWSSTKNSADIAIAIKAMADLVIGRVSNVVVLSDDSDFISLYVAIRDEREIPRVEGRPPFLWAVTDRKGPLSTTVEQFFPPSHLHIVSPERVRALKAAEAVRQLQSPPPEPSIVTLPVAQPPQPAPMPEHTPPDHQKDAEPPTPKPGEVFRDMARAVMEEIPVGPFKSGDAQAIIKRGWPTHQMARSPSASFGTHFKDRVWPFLEVCGVRIPNPNKKPIQYEMTVEAKDAISGTNVD